MISHLKRNIIPVILLGLLAIFGVSLLIIKTINIANANNHPNTTSGGGNQGAPAGTTLSEGDVSGFGWGATSIVTPGVSEGGVGWINFNCKTSFCSDFDDDGTVEASEMWGTNINLVRDANFGVFRGEAWSSNYGWISYDPNDISTCWEDNTFATLQGPATAMLDDAGPNVNVVGWARFINGADSGTDEYDGCISFGGANHQVTLNLNSGMLNGYAWGGPVTGWINFNGVSIVMPGTTTLNFWANQTWVDAIDNDAILNWEAVNAAPNYIASCNTYSNTSNYSHWRSTGLGTSDNVGTISTAEGNLPTGTHPVNNINQTTTYQLTCTDRYGVVLPTQYVTITYNDGEVGCMDPNASNYSATADVEGPCFYASTDLDLMATPNTLDINALSYDVGLTWTSNNPSELSSCVGSLDAGNATNWDGGHASPDVTTPFIVDLAPYAAGSSEGDTFEFTLTCQDSNGIDVTATETVTMVIEVPPPRPIRRLLLTATPGVIFENSPVPPINLNWNTIPANQLTSCEASDVDLNGNDIVVNNWTVGQSVPNPDYQSNWPVDLGTDGANAVVGDQFRFEITCMNGATPVSATAFVNVSAATFNPTATLRIPTPNNPPLTSYTQEQISAPNGYDPITLAWDNEDVDDCTARSMKYPDGVNADTPNPDFFGQSINPTLLGSLDLNISLTNPIPNLVHPTIFWLECDGSDGTTLNSNTVCVHINGIPFPTCSAFSSGNVPTYKEI